MYNELFSEEGVKDYCALIFNEISHRFSQGQGSEPRREPKKEQQREQQTEHVVPTWERPVTGVTGLISGDHGKLKVPGGWLECREAGTPLLFDGVLVLPCKAPLGPRWGEAVEPGSHFSPADIVGYMRTRYDREVGLVVNLSSTEKWYEPQQDWPPYVDYTHLDCGTKGEETLDGETVSRFCWAIKNFFNKETARCSKSHGLAPRSIVVHCTHGHNRTGFMLCAYLLRTMRYHAINHSVQQVAAVFAKSRPPGIYKPDVLAALHRLHLERIPEHYLCPPLPEWKVIDGEEPVTGPLAKAVPAPPAKEVTKMEHDDVIGEQLPVDMAYATSRLVYNLVTGKQSQGAGAADFPGNHPVNLTRGNINALEQKHFVTWKADGTRYLMLIVPEGAYLVSRNNDQEKMVRRVSIRCPRADGSLHSQTLLDGELVVDTDKKTGQQKRRFLVYDILSSGSATGNQPPQRYADRPFEERYNLIKSEFMEPYEMHKKGELKVLGYAHKYDWAGEEFTIRRKDFFGLHETERICNVMIPKQLPHESDGLIFQPALAPYEEGRCQNLFKWKYVHLNSVDFFFKGGKLFLGGNGRGEGSEEMHGARAVIDPLRAPDMSWPGAYEGHTIECVWVDAYLTEPGHDCRLEPDGADGEPRTWVFLRDRMFKGANGRKTYDGIMDSVRNKITQDQVIEACDEIRHGKEASIFEEMSQADKNRDKMKKHYDHTVQTVGSDYKGNRDKSRSIALKKYHNDIKRALTARFAHGAPKVLDLASGRGGDLAKWADQKVGYVLGMDISPGECEEANRRYAEMKALGQMGQLVAEYRSTDDIGQKVLHLVQDTPTPNQPFAVVSCMFAFHYFFCDVQTLKNFLETVSVNLCEGGIFMGCLPDGMRIKELVEESGIFSNEMVTIKKKWEGKAQPFGSTYTMAIVDTVTGVVGMEDDEGSEEYLAMLGGLLDGLAAKVGLRVLPNYTSTTSDPELVAKGRALEELLDVDDVANDANYKHFAPPFQEENEALAWASLVNATFVFQKITNRGPPAPQQAAAPKEEEEDDGWGSDLGEGDIDEAEAEEAMDEGGDTAAAAPAENSQSGDAPAAVAELTAMDEGGAAAAAAPGGGPVADAGKMARSKAAAEAFLASNREETGGKLPSVAIIVCFRIQKGQRREAELQEFMPHMRTMLGKLLSEKQIKKYHIFVIQQSNSQDVDGVKFNRGKLLNIGFEIAQQGYDSFVFHDVDLLPNEDLAPYYACVPTSPIHIAACWHERGYTANKAFFGGIVSFSKMNFTQVNGYPNNFWGWGGEDEVIMDRCTYHRIVPDKVQEGCLTDIEKNAEGETMDMGQKLEWLKRNEQWKCADRWERRAEDKTGWNTNGLNTLAIDHPYAEQRKLREDISELSTETAPDTKFKRLKGKKIGKFGSRIVVDLLFAEETGAEERKEPNLERATNAVKRKTADGGGDADGDVEEDQGAAKRSR